MLSDSDKIVLDELGVDYAVVEDVLPGGTWTGIIISDYVLPPGYDHEKTDMLVRLPPGFPDAAPDNFWIDPPLKNNRTGVVPANATGSETHHGRTWQFFSRHLTAAPWRPGLDDLRSWLNTIRRSLEQDGI
jgi:hypothetical protein